MINDLSKQIHAINVKNGFYENEKNIGEMLALIHSEVSEALECDRKNKYSTRLLLAARAAKEGEEPMSLYELLPIVKDLDYKQHFEKLFKDTFEDELADIMIRVMDLAAYKGIDLETHIKAKMKYNSMREYKHGKKY